MIAESDSHTKSIAFEEMNLWDLLELIKNDAVSTSQRESSIQPESKDQLANPLVECQLIHQIG